MKALVTGGSRGIGKAIVNRLEKDGVEVFAPERRLLDLVSDESVIEFTNTYANDYFDIIINNAGINPLSEINEVCPDILEQVLTVNLKAPILLLKGFVPKMKQKGYGRIVNISSVWGIVSKAGRVQYSASKFGINGVTKTLAVELGPNGILINSVCPGFTNTEMTIQNLSHEQMSELCREIPLGRFAEPCEIAELVAFLVSDKNTYITGQVIAADGGFTVR